MLQVASLMGASRRSRRERWPSRKRSFASCLKPARSRWSAPSSEPPYLPPMELRLMVPLAHLVTESVRTNFAHRSEHMNMEVSVVVVRVRSMNSDVDDHALASKLRGVILRQRETLFRIQLLGRAILKSRASCAVSRCLLRSSVFSTTFHSCSRSATQAGWIQDRGCPATQARPDGGNRKPLQYVHRPAARVRCNCSRDDVLAFAPFYNCCLDPVESHAVPFSSPGTELRDIGLAQCMVALSTFPAPQRSSR